MPGKEALLILELPTATNCFSYARLGSLILVPFLELVLSWLLRTVTSRGYFCQISGQEEAVLP